MQWQKFALNPFVDRWTGRYANPADCGSFCLKVGIVFFVTDLSSGWLKSDLFSCAPLNYFLNNKEIPKYNWTFIN